ncbi:hypothetical protein pipiens_001652 [Culex pipiens pipiens]|uniref:Homeobox domain-containing protein n=1 Tax=Culex pipiens pipiens TaxID=38569 RepID=A0ABD1CE25_CULPP
MPGPFLNAQEMVQAAHNHQHLLAAQFQAAAALAHVQAGQGFPPGGGGPHPHMLHPNHPNIPRDSYPLYPWLLSRHGRHVFPPRFPGTYLLPFRKPKRVRTAFSPSQLLKLEHAFENNHYVVGAERKQLAQTLCLTETQGLLDAKRGGKCLSLVSPFAAAAPSPQQEGGFDTPSPPTPPQG